MTFAEQIRREWRTGRNVVGMEITELTEGTEDLNTEAAENTEAPCGTPAYGRRSDRDETGDHKRPHISGRRL